jgi:hypothetical protein
MVVCVAVVVMLRSASSSVEGRSVLLTRVRHGTDAGDNLSQHTTTPGRAGDA